MKAIQNGFCDYYFMTKAGEVYNSRTDKYSKGGKKGEVTLTTLEGTKEKISLSTLYRLVYGERLIIDNVRNKVGEEWRAVAEIPNYFVSNYGRIKSIARTKAKIIAQSENSNGYKRIKGLVEGEKKNHFVHHLVAKAFPEISGTCQKQGWQLHHIDFDRKNNRADNLIYLSRQEHIEKHWGKKEEAEAEVKEN